MRNLVCTLALLSAPVLANVCGDLDGDGAVTVLDALSVARAGAGIVAYVGDEFLRGDVNADGRLDILDALRIARAGAGIPTVLSCAFPLPAAEEWTDVTPAPGSADIGPRCEHASGIDAPRNRGIFFSGYTPGGTVYDVWALDFATHKWMQLSPSGSSPAGDLNLKLTGDAARDRMLLFRGSTLYSLDFTSSASGVWSVLRSLPVSVGPNDTVDFDTVADRAIVVRGALAGPGILEVDFSSSPSGDARFYSAAGVLYGMGDIQGGIDRARNRYIVVDAMAGAVAAVDLSTVGVGSTPDVVSLAPIGSFGVSRNMAMSDFDDAGDQLLVFGGTSQAENGVTALRFRSGPDGEWVTLGATSPGPAACSHAAIVYDGDDELLIHGGAHLLAGGMYERTWSFEIR